MSQITPAQQLFDLTGEVALVTGASSGLGHRFAEVLAAHGAKVVAAARRTDRLKDLAASSGNIAPLALDVTDNASLGPALEQAGRAFGPLTLLVNNAGIGGGSRIIDTEPDEWDAVQETNVAALFHLSRAFAKGLIARQSPGAIINIASVVAEKVGISSASYAASKASVLHLTKAQAFEWAKHRIRVNAICPGYIHSEMTDDYLASPAGQEMIRRVPQRRVGNPSDLDGPLLLFASARASGFITGASLLADGGLALA
ncbi:MAG: SDR family oxidoreductase [Alphaproteobacteria bacterium]|uniref:SDR family NAD(P)-dependent oxidoreductase n=1 Tax=Aestuariivirga sp. TaxID=2650926 RepID=UPI003019C75B|nr:SDR family oxidoreductase [Alphaproteobacteria bacterium]